MRSPPTNRARRLAADVRNGGTSMTFSGKKMSLLAASLGGVWLAAATPAAHAAGRKARQSRTDKAHIKK